jgi:hypothetical protein
MRDWGCVVGQVCDLIRIVVRNDDQVGDLTYHSGEL